MPTTAKDKNLALREQLDQIRARRSKVVVEECVLQSDNRTLLVAYFFEDDLDTVECSEVLIPIEKWTHICENKVYTAASFYEDMVTVEWNHESWSFQTETMEQSSGKEEMDLEDFVNSCLSDDKVARDLLLEWVELDGATKDDPLEDPRYLLSQLKEIVAADSEPITGRAIARLTPHSYGTYRNYMAGDIGNIETLKDFIKAARLLASKKSQKFKAVEFI